MTPDELQAVTQAVRDATPQASVISPIVIGFFGAVFGAVSAVLSNWFLEWRKGRVQQQALLGSLTAEITAIIAIVEARGYMTDIQTCIEVAGKTPGGRASLEIRVPSHYSRIYQENADKIGLLPLDRAVSIIAFHQAIDAVVQDVIPGGAFNSPGAPQESFVQGKAILERALKIGLAIVGRPNL